MSTTPSPLSPKPISPLAPMSVAGSSGNRKITLHISNPGENANKPITFYDAITYEDYFKIDLFDINPTTNTIRVRFRSFESLEFVQYDDFLLEQMGEGIAPKHNLFNLNDQTRIAWNPKCKEPQGIVLPTRNGINSFNDLKEEKIHIYIEGISGNASSQTLKISIEGPFRQEQSKIREFKLVKA